MHLEIARSEFLKTKALNLGILMAVVRISATWKPDMEAQLAQSGPGACKSETWQVHFTRQEILDLLAKTECASGRKGD